MGFSGTDVKKCDNGYDREVSTSINDQVVSMSIKDHVVSMRKVRKKPVVVYAKQMQDRFYVTTLEGRMEGEPGDWLIWGVRGEYYPCKDSIFRKTYDICEE